jgi:hypothetical protein
LGVVVHAPRTKITSTARLEINPENGHGV